MREGVRGQRSGGDAAGVRTRAGSRERVGGAVAKVGAPRVTVARVRRVAFFPTVQVHRCTGLGANSEAGQSVVSSDTEPLGAAGAAMTPTAGASPRVPVPAPVTFPAGWMRRHVTRAAATRQAPRRLG